MQRRKMKKGEVDKAIKVAKFMAEKMMKSAFESYIKMRNKRDSYASKTTEQKRLWKKELENLQRINAISGQNPFTLFEVVTHDRK